MTAETPVPTTKWTTLAYHRRWLVEQAADLFDFFEASLDPKGGFYNLDDDGRPLPGPEREIWQTTRTVHSYAIGQLMGRPGADRFVDHGMNFLWNRHRDTTHGGYVWGVGGDERKQAYGHAFVLLAASSAKLVGHPDADRLLNDVTEVLETRFWEKDVGASAEEFGRDWSRISGYRGQNSNMHLTEATMAAFEATGNRMYLDWAESIATHIVKRSAQAAGWMIPEHFDERWEILRDFSDGDVFRPYGMCPGHSLEWTRLLLQLWELGGRRVDWLPEAARALFARATTDGWDTGGGGFFYTMGWDGRPHHRNLLWWPVAEGVGAAAFLNEIDGDPTYEVWYRRIWDAISAQFIDWENGAWRTEPAFAEKRLFTGKPDIYHSLQACLIPLLPTTGSITHGLCRTGLKDI